MPPRVCCPRVQAGHKVEQAAMHLGKQPSLFERCFSFRCTRRPVQNQRFGFIHVPNRRAHRVPTETLQCSNPFVAVDDQESVWFVSQGNDHNRNLLASFGERSQQTPFAVRPAHPKPLVTQIELMKFQFHSPLPWPSLHRWTITKAGSGLSRFQWKCPPISCRIN